MTRTSTATLAVAADYADAMMTARRAKNWLFILLLLVLLSQLAIFFLARLHILNLGGRVTMPEIVPATSPTTAPVEGDSPATAPTSASSEQPKSYPVATILRYVIPVENFLGLTLMIVLSVVLLLITLIMLVGRLIGVSHVTSAFIWSVLLLVFLFPWQSFLLTGPRDASPGASIVSDDPSFKIPGVLYTWPELAHDYEFPTTGAAGILKWARFAGMPIVAVLLLLMVQAKSSRGLKYALGESDVQIEVTTPAM
jgi:hypothetical protein